MSANDRGHYPIPLMQVELGVWHGTFQNQPIQPWVRWWDDQGNLLLTGQERAAQAEAALEQTRRAAIAQLTALGMPIEQIAATLQLSIAAVQHLQA